MTEQVPSTLQTVNDPGADRLQIFIAKRLEVPKGDRVIRRAGILFWPLFLLLSTAVRAEEADAGRQAVKASSGKTHSGWRQLFNGKDLSGWKSSLFGGDGEIRAISGQIEIGLGTPMSGMRYLGKVPKLDYELRLEAKRISGNDFFCGLTFPVRQSHCSLIVGGWGGGVVGLSNIDGLDASENGTTQYISLESNRWYRIRVRVTTARIEAWLDEKQIVNQDIHEREISLRNEMFPTRPLGLATWQTAAVVRNFQIRPLKQPVR